jgi:PAS domain S-box-containing protein
MNLSLHDTRPKLAPEKNMISKHPLKTTRPAIPPMDANRIVALEGEIKKHQAATATDPGLRIEQAETRTEQANVRTEQAETRTEQANIRTEQAEIRTEQANIRTDQAHTRIEQAETRIEQANTRTEQAETRTELANTRTEQAETRSEQAVRASEIRYRRLFEAAKDGIFILDVDTGRINDVNPYLAELLGFSHDEMVGKTVGELSPFKDFESNKVMLGRLQKDRYARYDDLPLETRDGRKIAVEFVSNVYEAGDHDVIQCNIRDITARKQAETALLRLAAIVESSDDAIIGKDLSSNITSWNRGAEKIFGYTAGEMVGTSIMRLIPADRQDEENMILSKIKHSESVEHFETLRQVKDGGQIDVSVTASPIKDASGKVTGVSKVVREITERKAAEEKIRQLNVDLEQRVTERTAQLKSANEELEAFSYSVSHDLRAPLRHVMGFVNLLLKDAGQSLSEKSLQHLNTISKSTKRMGDLIDDLLTFSRVGRAEMQKATVNLDELVKDTLGDFQTETSGRTIVWDIHPLPVVRADRALLRLVLVNLISNAVKFTSHRAEAKIEIGCVETVEGQEARDESQIVIFVRDNGAGFDPQYAHKLFGVFQRLHSNEEFEGTGIGLANVQRIIQRHDGRVWAEGAVDGGATFYFSIPKQSNGATNGH